MSSARWGAVWQLAIFIFIVCASLTLLPYAPFDPNQSDHHTHKTRADQCEPKLRAFGLDRRAQSNQAGQARECRSLSTTPHGGLGRKVGVNFRMARPNA